MMRTTVPKADSGLGLKCSVFNMLRFSEMHAACLALLKLLELAAFRILNFIYTAWVCPLRLVVQFSKPPPLPKAGPRPSQVLWFARYPATWIVSGYAVIQELFVS